MTYQTHRNRLAALYARLEIVIGKITHAPRIYAARRGEEAGLSDVVSTKVNSCRSSVWLHRQ
jgi:hypothetical protein